MSDAAREREAQADPTEDGEGMLQILRDLPGVGWRERSTEDLLREHREIEAFVNGQVGRRDNGVVERLKGREDMSSSIGVAILERAKEHGFPALSISSGSIEAGEMAWRIAAQALTPTHLSELGAAFDEIDARAEAHRRRPLDPDDPNDLEAQAVQRDLEESTEISRRKELPATRGQLEELIGLQRETLEALRNRR